MKIAKNAKSSLGAVLLIATGYFILGPSVGPILHLDMAIDFIAKPFLNALGLKVIVIATAYSVLSVIVGQIYFPTSRRVFLGVALAIELTAYVVAHLIAL